MTNLFSQEPWARRGEQPARTLGMSELPIGVPVPWPAATAPTGWLICDGGAVPAGCPTLTSLYGANLPDLKGKVIVGLDAAQIEFDTLGDTGGANTVTLLTANMPAHDHSVEEANQTDNTSVDHTHNLNGLTGEGGTPQVNRKLFAVGGASASETTTGMNESNHHRHGLATNGSDTAHNNLQPYRVFNYIVKAG